jgi:hypothetical protein
MASWLIPTLKAILPHVGDLVSTVRPVFTRKKPDAAAPGDLLQRQIAELQAAAAQSAEHLKQLEARLGRAVLLCTVAAAVSVVSLLVALAALTLR